MPTYEYQCQCGHNFEQEQRISEAALETCPICKDTKCKNWKKNKGCKVERVINAAGFVLKGGGWYKDGYGSAKAAKESSGKDSNVGTAKADSTPKNEKTSTETKTSTESASKDKNKPTNN